MEKELKKIDEINPRLAEYLEKNSRQDSDMLIFDEQDATTLAANITIFLKGVATPKITE
ncbi:MAG: hypothetical protein WC223_13180 [Bacteroidales bacterium]|jgi:hypothetical protein